MAAGARLRLSSTVDGLGIQGGGGGRMRRSLKNRFVARAAAAAATKIHRLGCGSGGGHGANSYLEVGTRYPLGKGRWILLRAGYT